MASTAFPDLAKKAVLRDGTTYGYIHVPPRDPLKPTLLLLHGFPSSSYDWRHQITHLPAAGFGVLVPDLLGYGDTDKPDDPEKYRLANMASQVDELLSHVGLEKVIGVAHDWGSGLLSSLWAHYKHRFLGLSFAAVGYTDVGKPLNIDMLQEASKAIAGYTTSGYMRLFVTPEGPKLLDEHSRAWDNLLYAADPDTWREHFGAEGGLKKFLTSGQADLPVASWVSPEEIETHHKILASGGYTAPTYWYKAQALLGPTEKDLKLTPEDKKITVPVLLLHPTKDRCVLWEVVMKPTLAVAEDVQVEKFETGHWLLLEERERYEKLLEEFASRFQRNKL